MAFYHTPGVFVEEIPTLAPSVVAVSTAIPAFIGYTELAGTKNIDDRPLSDKAVRIKSLLDYRELFGGPFPETFGSIAVDLSENPPRVTTSPTNPGNPSFWLYYQLQMFYANGGGPCYIVSVGGYTFLDDGIVRKNFIADTKLRDGINALEKEDEPTLILIPDALGVSDEGVYYALYQHALLQCSKLKNRFTIIDLQRGDEESDSINSPIPPFRTGIGANNLNYGAAYYPWLETTLGYTFRENEISVTGRSAVSRNPLPENTTLKYDTSDLSLLDDSVVTPPLPPESPARENAKRAYYEARSLYHLNAGLYQRIVNTLNSFRLNLPPGPALAGIYTRVDNQKGVYKAPANVSMANVARLLIEIDDQQQEDLNNPVSGKAINAIRFFQGRGRLVWGARTLDAVSNEWRFIPVRRFFLFAEESIKRALHRFVFEPNDSGTWVTIKSMINSFLLQQWRTGALVGAKEEQAFYVSVGLGETMSSQDVLEGRLIVEVGMAVVRPAEFIILKFTHKLQEA